MLEVTRDTDVYTADDDHVGRVDRIVLDPVSRQLTHIVVRKGVLFREDKIIRFDDIATATPVRINLRQGVDVDGLQPFVEQHYVPLDEADLSGEPDAFEPAFASVWAGPIGTAMPIHRDALVAVRERNIPERLTALDAGALVLAADGQAAGRLEGVVTTDAALPTHLVIDSAGRPPERRALPIGWVDEVREDAVVLGVTARMVQAITPLDRDD